VIDGGGTIQPRESRDEPPGSSLRGPNPEELRYRLSPEGSHLVVDVRPPLLYRALMFVGGAGLFGFGLLGAQYSVTSGRLVGFGSVAIFGAVAWACWRTATSRLTLERDIFVVRSFFRTERIQRSDVDRFELGDNPYGIDLWPRDSFRRIAVNAIMKNDWTFWMFWARRRKTKAEILVDKQHSGSTSNVRRARLDANQ
jgi:hypothetical protein